MPGRNNIYLAPLAGITDTAMREVCIECGAGLTFTEMVSAKGIQYHNDKTLQLLALSRLEDRVGVQLFGREPIILAETAAYVEELLAEGLAEINLNMGCPAPKIVKNGEGSALMLEPALAGEIISVVSRAVRAPVTVKIRKGFDEDNCNAVDFAKMAEQNGAAEVIVHGRTRSQYYSGKADWEIIREVKESVGIPVVGNGDIFCAQDAKKMMDETGCDAVMVARGALGNPFIFTQIGEYLKMGSVTGYPSAAEKVSMCLRQAKIAVAQKGEHLAILQMRKHAAYYLKGLPDSAKTRNLVVQARTLNELQEMLQNYLECK